MFDSVKSLLASKLDSPIIFLFGEDEFSREEAQNAIIEKFVATEEDKFNFDVFDGDSSSINSIIDLCRSYPMMSDKRVVLVKRFDKLFSGRVSKKIETTSPINSYINSPALGTKLILVAEIESAKDIYKAFKSGDKDKFQKKISSIKFPFNLLIQKCTWMEFPRVYESEYPRWTKDRFRHFGKTIQPEAIDILLSKTKQSLRDISNEVEKLVLATSDKDNLTVDDINFLTGSTREYNVFELQRSIAGKDISKSVVIISKILSVDRQEMLILAILSKFFTNLMKIIEDFKSNINPQQLASKLGISPFQFNDYQLALKNYNMEDIENALISLTNTDLKLKSYNTDSIMIMQNMLFEVMDKKHENSPLL